MRRRRRRRRRMRRRRRSSSSSSWDSSSSSGSISNSVDNDDNDNIGDNNNNNNTTTTNNNNNINNNNNNNNNNDDDDDDTKQKKKKTSRLCSRLFTRYSLFCEFPQHMLKWQLPNFCSNHMQQTGRKSCITCCVEYHSLQRDSLTVYLNTDWCISTSWHDTRGLMHEHHQRFVLFCWLLNVTATCECISGTDLLRQVNLLPHWDRSCRSNFLLHPVTVYWHQANQSKCWPYNARQGSHWSAKFKVTGMTRPWKNPAASRIRTQDLPLLRWTP